MNIERVKRAISALTSSMYFIILKLLALLILPFYLYSRSLDHLEQEASICLVKRLFDVECFGCGITKAVIATLQVNFERAFHYNTLVIVVFPLLFYVWLRAIYRIFKSIFQR